ncbi:Nramp family divalent metal transporter [Fulvivirga sedimenti]|uniref:Nramp family divalent metal transporter n=1 Tax=Fulvivirga sedimenti TaxID=2879465 RepID=A0A9X1L035_9BACT|nr:Nramp family divalent metal transporter [Fulvivirga sedimenti]MCA6079040.1 Nramp family divalent metal transporter [Fulvivirga sedimenti]
MIKWLKRMPVRRRLLSILFWSVIAAAFIGPGTLVTASSAGSLHGFSLAWTLIFATVACIVFQEMAARLTLVTKKDLATTVSGFRHKWLIAIIPFSVVLGCIAYEAGNIQGAVAGMSLLLPFSSGVNFMLVGVLAAALLALSAFQRLIQVLGALVAVMGIAFLVVAYQVAPDPSGLIRHIAFPEIPEGSAWLVLGLIGTTVVPYNLFLGSGISRDDSVGMMRFGLIISIVLGGIISLAILVTGTLMNGATGLADLISVTGKVLGSGSEKLVALGLFAAGFTSSITAPFAAGLIVKGFLFHNIKDNGRIVRITSLSVLFIGVLSGLLDFRPEVIILAAQSANGLVLPLVTALLWVLSNRYALMGDQRSTTIMNILAFLLLNVLLILGMRNMLSGASGMLGLEIDAPLLWLSLISLPMTLVLGLYVHRIRAA